MAGDTDNLVHLCIMLRYCYRLLLGVVSCRVLRSLLMAWEQLDFLMKQHASLILFYGVCISKFILNRCLVSGIIAVMVTICLKFVWASFTDNGSIQGHAKQLCRSQFWLKILVFDSSLVLQNLCIFLALIYMQPKMVQRPLKGSKGETYDRGQRETLVQVYRWGLLYLLQCAMWRWQEGRV